MVWAALSRMPVVGPRFRALARAAAHFRCEAGPVTAGWSDGLPRVAAWAPVGPSAAALPEDCLRVRRAWDEAAWPLSNRGYSRLRAAIPRLTGA